MVRRNGTGRAAALTVVAAASAVVLLASWSASAAARWAFAFATVAFPPALIWLGVSRRRGRRSPLPAVVALLVLLEAATIGVLTGRGAAEVERWFLGLPPPALALVFGLWLAPFVLTTWAYLATFDPTGLTPEALASLRSRRATAED